MILNSFAVLDGFLTLLRLVVALLVIALAVPLWRAGRRTGTEARERLEDRSYLLYLLAFLLLFLNLASWPVFYLLLESYVPEWPGVMCIYGVTQVGAGSLGPSRFLPALLQALQILKPLLVFASGAWFMLYLANRQAARAPLTGRILIVLALLGVLAVADCTLEAAYLTIPKKEDIPDTGCCTGHFEDDARFLPSALLGDEARPWLGAAFYGVNLAMILALFVSIHTLSARNSWPRLGPLLAGALLALAVSGAFLIDVAAPAWLRLPHHHCPYDLIARAPEAVLAVASFLGATFAVGWAGVTRWFAHCPETEAILPEQIRQLLVLALFAYAGSLVMVSIELAFM